jgi:hypothetical protein
MRPLRALRVSFLFQLFYFKFSEVQSVTSEQETAPRRRGIGQGRGERRQYTNRSGKAGHVSPAIVEKYLAGMHYPAEKKKLVVNAQNKAAPDDVMNLINKLPDKTYNSPIDITKEIGKISNLNFLFLISNQQIILLGL